MTHWDDDGWGGSFQVRIRKGSTGAFVHYAWRPVLDHAVLAARKWLIGQAFPAAVMVIDADKPADSPAEYLSQSSRRPWEQKIVEIAGCISGGTP